MPNTMRKLFLPAIGACALLSAAAMGNDGADLLTNPGFEDPNPGMPNLPLGWNGFNVSADDYVDANDPDGFVRTGDRSIRLRPATGESSRFQGWTTNIFRPDGSDLFDPDYTYLGGDVTVSGYYLVPEGETIQDTIVGVKLEFRREPPNFSIWSAFEFALPASSTGGLWMPFSFVVTDAMIEAVGDFPPEPTSVSVLPFRFFGDAFGPGTSPTGTVYFDDLCIVQGGSDCPADFTGDGTLDIFDVFAFLDAFNTMDPSADFTDDGLYDIFDVFAFLDAFNAGCP